MAYGNGGYGAGQAMGGPIGALSEVGQSTPPRVPLVMMELERLMKVSEHLHDIINELENRIVAVVRPEGPTNDRAADKATPPIVQLAGGLAEIAARFEHACHRLQSLNVRIEL